MPVLVGDCLVPVSPRPRPQLFIVGRHSLHSGVSIELNPFVALTPPSSTGSLARSSEDAGRAGTGARKVRVFLVMKAQRFSGLTCRAPDSSLVNEDRRG